MATDACTENAATSDATGNSSPIEESAEASLQRMGPDLAAKVIRAFTQCQSQAAAETSAQDAASKAMKDLLPNGVHDSVASKISVLLETPQVLLRILEKKTIKPEECCFQIVRFP